MQHHQRLDLDLPARVADVACGVGWAAIAIARAYPRVLVDGFHPDELSIELAPHHAGDAGLSDRVTFQARDAAEAEAGAYDLAVIIEAVHDMTQPVGVLASLRRMLRPDGVALIADEKTEDTFIAPAGDAERLCTTGTSTLTCLPAATTEQPTAAIGMVIRADTMRGLGAEAQFVRRTARRAGTPRAPLLPDDAIGPFVNGETVRPAPARAPRAPGRGPVPRASRVPRWAARPRARPPTRAGTGTSQSHR